MGGVRSDILASRYMNPIRSHAEIRAKVGHFEPTAGIKRLSNAIILAFSSLIKGWNLMQYTASSNPLIYPLLPKIINVLKLITISDDHTVMVYFKL